MSGASPTTSRRLIVNALLNLTTQVCLAVINILLIDFFLRTLGDELYGVWIIVGAIFSYRTQLTLGLNSAVNRHVPVALATGDTAALRRILSTAAGFFTAFGLLLFGATLVLYAHLDAWFDISPAYIGAARLQALVIGVSFAVAMSMQLYTAALSGLQRYDLINGPILGFTLLRTALVVWLLQSGHGIVTMALIYGSAEIGIRAVHAVSSLRLLPAPSPRAFDLPLLREFVTYGASTALYSAGAVLIYKSCDLVIGAFLSPELVPRFYIATTPLILLSTLVQVLTAVAKPAVSDLDARDQSASVREMALLGQKYTLLLILPSVAFFVFAGEPLLQLWVGDNFDDPSVVPEIATVMAILALGHGLRLTQHSNFIVLVGRGIHLVYGISVGITTACSIGLAIAAASVWDMGLVGVALACAVPIGITSAGVLAVYFNRRMEIPLGEALRRVWWPALLGTGPAVLLVVLWSTFAPPDRWLELLLLVAAAGAATLAASWGLALDAQERARFVRIVRRDAR